MSDAWGGAWGTAWGVSWGAGAAVAATTNRGGWLSAEQVASLRKIARRTEKTRQRRWKAKRDEQAEFLAELSQIYNRIEGIIVASPEAEDVRDAVRDYVQPKGMAPGRVPLSSRIDFVALLASAQATARLATALAQLGAERRDEEVFVLLMLTA